MGHLAGVIGSVAIFFAAGGYDVAMGRQRGDPPSTVAVILILFALLAFVAGIVCWAVLLYRMWAQVQRPGVRTTPGQAVGFSFIPLFNIVWNFIAFHGLSQELNKYCQQRNIPATPVTEGLALTSCILLIGMFIPCLNLVVALAYLPIVLISLWQMVAASQCIARANRAAPPTAI